MPKRKTILTYACIVRIAFICFAMGTLSSLPTNAEDIKLQVLSWDENIEAMVAQVDENPVRIAAETRRISVVYEIRASKLLSLHYPAKNGIDLGKPMVNIVIKPGMREVLLILSKKKKQYRAALLPFARKQFPDNTVTFFNLTTFSVFAKIGEETQKIKAKARYQVPYQYAYEEHESLRTRFAVEQDGRMRIVQNGFVPLVHNGRVLFFIRENTVQSNRESRYPVSFSYAFDPRSSRSEQQQSDQVSAD